MAAKSIVCGVTGSDASHLAARQAARLAKEDGAALTFVYAVDAGFLHGLTIQLRAEYAESALLPVGRHILQDAVAIAAQEGVTARSELRKGKVLDVIKQVVAETGSDLLVLGDEGRTFTEKVLFGGEVLDHVNELQEQTGARVLIVR